MALRTLQRSKQREGLGVPTIHKYYEAIVLHWILYWDHGVTTKRWVPLEKKCSRSELGSGTFGTQRVSGVV